MIEELLQAKKLIQQAVDARDTEMREIALKIHANPELAFNEYKAVHWLTEPLKKADFQVEMGIAGLETAFRASWSGGAGGPIIAFLAEYDALPEIGHACGHNLIGTAAVGAALALKDAFPDFPGTIEVFGTPAEEDGGGKIIMCEKGVFDHVDAAMLCHPRQSNMVMRGGLACVDTTLKFYGKQAHASSEPEKGISALEALINSYVAINSLRQFFKQDVRIHGIISRGGDAANVVPDYCEAKFMFRAPTVKELHVVREKVYAAARHCTEAVGARFEMSEGLIYAERNNNKYLSGLFKDNLTLMGLEVTNPPERGGIGSSDIGNVGQVTATIHPYIRIGDVTPHTPEFRDAAGSEGGMTGLNQAAKALAMTAYDLCYDPDSLRQVRDEFEKWKSSHEAIEAVTQF
ncbi:amidohydrolase [Paenibacillus sp. yr247]|uniref:M20 family metallopeptidase n=1 Tax=Paenibacillus sp. yr247 TaxID=1761880 RepID=UPI000885CEF4|nr:M20 family metallopeptidase [Paenibacillus sp. yr247]SDN24313.1 amidohydrolase [Paenibacillus sp. yr247]